MELPDRNTDYRDKSYWDDRYSKEKAFDWFSDYEEFKHLLKDDIKPADKILILGECVILKQRPLKIHLSKMCQR